MYKFNNKKNQKERMDLMLAINLIKLVVYNATVVIADEN